MRRIKNNGAPAVDFLAPMFRRRLSRLSRMALRVAFECVPPDIPVHSIFCSQHGELTRTLTLLNSMVDGEPLSPTAFGMSVHNTAAGLFSIARKDMSPTTAIASGSDTLESGFLHAAAALKTGYCSEVLLVIADEPLPATLDVYSEKHSPPHAVAFLLTMDKVGNTLSLSAVSKPQPPHQEAHGLSLLRLLIEKGTRLEIPTKRLTWVWGYNDR